MSIPTTSIQCCSEVLARIKKEKKKFFKSYIEVKGRNKAVLFAVHVMMYKENSMGSTKRLQELIS